MSNEHEETDQHLEAALKSLHPAAARLDRDALMFRAGQASCRGRGRRLSVATAVVSIAVSVVATYVAVRPSAPVSTRVEYVRVIEPEAPRQAPNTSRENKPPRAVVTDKKPRLVQQSPESGLLPLPETKGYVGLRDNVLRWGVDMIPSSPTTPSAGTSSPSSLLQMYAAISEKPGGY